MTCWTISEKSHISGGKYALMQQRSDKPDKQTNTDKG